MKWKLPMIKRLIAILTAVLLLSGCSANGQPPEQSSEAKAMEVIWYDEQVYQVGKKSSEAYEVSGKMVAGVIPHHGVASRLMDSFYKTLEDEYDAVVILGPDHYNAGKGIVFSACSWQTILGTIEPDAEFCSSMAVSLDLKASQADDAIQHDHSVSWHLPYVADYLPSAKVVPVLLSSLTTTEQLNAMVKLLEEYSQSHRLLVIASIDFSHYLMPDDAMAHNETTKRLIDGRDYNRILKLNSDNIDSPETLYVFLKYCDSIGAEVSLLDESISNIQSGTAKTAIDPGDGTTTYLVYGAHTEKSP